MFWESHFFSGPGLGLTTLAGAGGPGTMATVEMGRGAATAGTYGTLLAWLTFAFLTASLVFRTIATGHGPFANMYEFSVAFAWGILVTYLYFERKYHQKILGVVALPISLAMLLSRSAISLENSARAVGNLIP
jgi:ABC-type transport system involved in cytochrome c biogenesis permease subunit